MRASLRCAVLAAFVAGAGIAAKAAAHDCAFVIGRDDANPPRIQIAGPPNYLNGRESLDLIPGDDVLKGFWFNDVPGFATLKQAGADRHRLRLRTGHRLAIRLVRHDPGFCLVEASTWRPVLARDGDVYEFFRDATGDFVIQMVSRVNAPGRFRATMQFIDRAGLHADSEPFELCFRVVGPADLKSFACPMRCERNKTYPRAGKCPVCGMRLADTRAHLDHKPRHGGIFFMAPDYVHHLEGALTERGEYRVYFYDEYTRPIAADLFAARAEFRESDGRSTPMHLKPVASREYLAAPVPAAPRTARRVILFVDFRDGGGPQRFDFDFP